MEKHDFLNDKLDWIARFFSGENFFLGCQGNVMLWERRKYHSNFPIEYLRLLTSDFETIAAMTYIDVIPARS